MSQQRRLVIRGIALTGQVQRLFEEFAVSDFTPVEVTLELDTYAEHQVYVGWSNADGSKPQAITAQNGLPLEPEQIRTLRAGAVRGYPNADYHQLYADFRQLCWQAHSADRGRILTVSYWELIDAVNPI